MALRGDFLVPTILLLASLAAGLVLARPHPATPRLVAHRPIALAHAAPVPKRSAPRKIETVHKPSIFQQEQAMSRAALMSRWEPFIKEASLRFNVPQAWIRAAMRMESGGRTMLGENQPITSKAGAMGIMQVMPETWREMRALYGLGPNPYDPHDSVIAGTALLKILYGKYGYPSMFAAYNAGPGTLDAARSGTRMLPAETVAYVGGITRALNGGGGGSGVKATLTRPNGTPVAIDIGAVTAVRAALPGEYAPGVQSVISIGRLKQGVRETLARATAIIRAHGGGV